MTLSTRQFGSLFHPTADDSADPKPGPSQSEEPAPKKQAGLADRYPGYVHPPEFANLIRQQDVAAHLNVAPNVVSNWVARGRMPTPKLIFGMTALWDSEQITKWHESGPRPKSRTQP